MNPVSKSWKANTIIIPLIIMFIGLGCDVNSSENISLNRVCAQYSQGNELWPMEVGNFWQYRMLDYGEEVFDTLRVEVIAELNRIERVERVFVVKSNSFSNPSEARYRLWSNSNGSPSMVGQIVNADTVWADFVTYPHDPIEGNQFLGLVWGINRTNGLLEVRDSVEYTVSSVSRQITVGSETFNTFEFMYNVPALPDVFGDDVYLNFKPGIGQVARIDRVRRSDPFSKPLTQYLLQDRCLMVSV